MLISESIKQLVSQDLVNEVPIDEIAANHGISRTSVYRIKKKAGVVVTKAVSQDLKLRTVQQQLLRQKASYRGALDKLAVLEKTLVAYQQFDKINSLIIPTKWGVLPKSKKEAVAFTLASDWHLDEEVNPAEIGGVNAYNLSIAKQRIEEYFKVVLKLINMLRGESTIKRLIIGALGDAISGWIHEELMEASSMTPTEAIVQAFELWVNGLDFLLRESDLEEIDIICCCGNHSRITKKNEIKKSHLKSYEWLLYQFLVKSYAMKGETRLKFKLPEGYFNWITVFERDIRFHHGNRIRYGGGIGGIHIPLRKAIAQWNKTRHADLDLLGHWHTRETSRDYVINSSVIGYNEFAEFIKADYAPPEQAFFLIHPKYGKTAEFPIVLS